jgi:hypothetical protein
LQPNAPVLELDYPEALHSKAPKQDISYAISIGINLST